MEERNSTDLREERIAGVLKKLGYDYNALKGKDKAYLIQIDESIQAIFKAETEAREALCRSVVSTKAISKSTGIARQTFYNNPILNEFVNFYANQFKKVDMSNIQNQSNQKIKELQEQLELMHLRDIEFEEMKIQIEELKQAIKERDETIASLRERKGTILTFPQNKFHN